MVVVAAAALIASAFYNDPADAVSYKVRWPGFRPLNADSSGGDSMRIAKFAPPNYLQSITDTRYGTTITRVSADSGALLVGGDRMGADGRNRYSKISFWNTDMTLAQLENKTTTSSGDCSSCPYNGGSYTSAQGGSNIWVDGQSFREVSLALNMALRGYTNDNRWNPDPTDPDVMYTVRNSPNAFIGVNVRTGVTQDSIALSFTPDGIGPSEGQISADGRWVVVLDSTKTWVASPRIQIVDLFRNVAWPIDSININSEVCSLTNYCDRRLNSSGDFEEEGIGHITMSPSGKYLVVKWGSTPEIMRYYSVDTTTRRITPQVMALGGMRSCRARGLDDISHTADDYLQGWGAQMSHDDGFIDENGDDWFAGGERAQTGRPNGLTGVSASADTAYCATSPENQSAWGADSGKVIAQRVKDGLVVRMSIGRKHITPTSREEAAMSHTSGTNIHRPGWVYIANDPVWTNGILDTSRRFIGEMVAWRLDTTGYGRRVQRFGHHRTVWDGSPGTASQLAQLHGPTNNTVITCYRSEPHFNVSPDGRSLVFPSMWRFKADTLNTKRLGMWTWRKSYVIDASDTTTFFVRGSRGSDLTGDGTFRRPFRTISKVNAVLRAGDTADIDSLAVADSSNIALNRIDPRKSGTPQKYITYRGNVGNPHRVMVPDVRLRQRFISIRGFRIKDHIEFEHIDTTSTRVAGVPADYDSISWCMIAAHGDTSKPRGVTFTGTRQGVLYGNTIYGPVKVFGVGSGALACSTAFCSGKAPSEIRITKNTIRLGRLGPLDVGALSASGTAQRFMNRHGVWFAGRAERCVMDSNRVIGRSDTTGVVGASNQSSNLLRVMNGRNLEFVANKWTDSTSTPNIGGSEWKLVTLRDSTRNCVFMAETTLVDTSYVYGTNRAHYDMSEGATNTENDWNRCLVRLNGDAAYWSGTFHYSDITRSTFISGTGRALYGLGPSSHVSIALSTFMGYRKEAARFVGAFDYLSLQSNVFWRQATASPDSMVVRYDNTATSPILSCDFNLYYSPTDSVCHAIYYNGQHGSPFHYRHKNRDPSFDEDMFCRDTLKWYAPEQGRTFDLASIWENPDFTATDVTTATAACACNPGTFAINPNGGYVGSTVPNDQARATSPGNLTQTGNTTTTQIEFTWAASADDSVSGASVRFYDVRYSTSPIEEENFYSASPWPGPSSPTTPGSTETVAITGLTPDTQYYIAVKAVNSCNNASEISSLLCAYTINPASGTSRACE